MDEVLKLPVSHVTCPQAFMKGNICNFVPPISNLIFVRKQLNR